MESFSADHRNELNRRISALSGRDLQLWSLGFLVMVVMASGILCFALPNHDAARMQLRYLPQISIGLIALVLLLNIYLIEQRRTVERLRAQLVREAALDEGFERFSVLDPATHVFRRSYLPDLLEREVARANREGSTLTFVRVNHDPMDRLTARFGRATAELVLGDIANVLQQNFRGSDRVVRYSDSEFLVLMPGTSVRQSVSACVRLQDYVDRWNLLTDTRCEMCLTTATAEYHAGMDAVAILRELMSPTEPMAALEPTLELVRS